MVRKKKTARKTSIKLPQEPTVKKVELKPAEVAQVLMPPGHVPVVVADPVRKVVEIAPVPAKKKRGWFMRLFN